MSIPAIPTLPGRAAEVRALNSLTRAELEARAGRHLTVVRDLDALHEHFAESVLATLRASREIGRSPALILPWGPIAQYPILSRLLAAAGTTLRGATLLFMDEYAGQDGRALPRSHPLSFRGEVGRWLRGLDPGLRPASEDLLFPDRGSAGRIERRIAEAGGVEVCYGGIGLHGHLAFNEPQPGVSRTGIRRVALNEFTRTINAIRAGVGGDLENFPRSAWTLGMRQCLGARRIELYCRSNCGLDWAKTVLRLALLGRVADDYPVTWIQRHPNYRVVADRQTAEPPSVRLP